MWEILDQPGKLAYALLARASAFALAGDAHDGRTEGSRGLEHAKQARDGRVAAFLGMLMSDMATAEESLVLLEEARRALGSTPRLDDELRLEARRLRAGALSEEQIGEWDRKTEAEGVGVTARAEWWTSRARSWVQGRRVGRDEAMVARMIRLVREPMPMGVRGPAVDAARALAAQAGDGESTRLLSSMQVKLSLDFLEHVPSWLREQAASVGWVLETQGVGDGDSVGRARNLEVLVRSLGGRESLRGLLDRALDALVLWTGVERGLLLLRAPGDRLVVRAARNLERRDLEGEQIVLSHSLARRALTSREPVVAVDAAGEIADVHHSVHALGLRSVLAVPLLARGDVLGVAYLDDRVRVGAFGPQELSWVRLVAGIAAMAIADARSQLMLRREARRAERAEARVKEDLARREAELEQAERALASEKGGPRRGYDGIVGESEAVRTMLSLVERVAATDLPVLVEGESGSGKELVARALHEHGSRVREPFVTENCSAIPEPLFESTLFGHVRGAFTGADRRRVGLFEAADGGTLFLDEVGEIPLHLQSKLLRVLQDGEVHPLGSPRPSRVNVRVIAATNRDLRDRVTAGRFREDLYYRLNVITIPVPSLRERIGDVPVLVKHFLRKYGQGRKVKVSKGAWSKLESYDWPGNVRQLENEIRRALALCEGAIGEEDLTAQVRGQVGVRAVAEDGLNMRARVDALERTLVQEAMEKTGGNQTRAALVLGVSRYGLQKMIKRLGLG
jgi:transcriptional regulator with GAF, ATPase, and Fis domain